MYAILDALAAQPQTGLFFVDYHGHRRDYTFGEVSEQSQRYAAVLRALGVHEGERVAMCNANTQKCLFLLLALERLGARAVLCSESLSGEELLERFKQYGVTTIVANRRRSVHVDFAHEQLPPHTRYVLVGADRDGWARMDTLAVSAKPYAGESASAPPSDVVKAVAGEIFGAAEGDRVWTTLPFASRFWFACAHAPLYSHAATIVHEGPFDPLERLDLLHELSATVLCQPAAEFEALLDRGSPSALRLPRLRRCIALDAGTELRERWELQTGRPLESPSFDRFLQGKTPA